MKIHCLGAVRTVTGSSFQIENPKGGLTLLDCGLFQGGRQTEMRNFNTALYRPDQVHSIVITHAHMDHSGLVPRLVKNGYRGPVYATEATTELLKILWLDAAHIQEHESNWKTKKNSRQGRTKVEPLYDQKAAQLAGDLLKPLPLDTPVNLDPGLTMKYLPAGHILGAASVHLTVEEDGGHSQILFSGDLGRTGQLLIPDPATPPKSDVIFMETTYGNRLHKDLGNSKKELIDIINTAYQEKGKILIPAFAVERTQEILFLLSQAWHDGSIPKDIPVILDSPLATSASEVFLKHPQLMNDETRTLVAKGLSPLTMTNLTVTRSMEESQKINQNPEPAIILAGSGMANAGRILHHFKHNLWRPNCHIIFVGFQAEGTTGRRLIEGTESVNIFREPILVKARIHTIGGFSGHADQNELLEWLRPQVHPGLTVNLIHGEESSSLAFETLVRKTFPKLTTRVPHWREILEINSTIDSPLDLPKPIITTQTLEKRLVSLNNTVKKKKQPLNPEKLARLEDLLKKAEEIIIGD